MVTAREGVKTAAVVQIAIDTVPWLKFVDPMSCDRKGYFYADAAPTGKGVTADT